MDYKVVETPNSYKAYLRPWISYPKFVEIQKQFTDTVTIDPKDSSQEITPFSASVSLEVEEKLMRYLIVKIEDKEGKEVDRSEDYLPLPPEDCIAIKDVIDEISSKAAETFTKKKLTTLPS